MFEIIEEKHTRAVSLRSTRSSVLSFHFFSNSLTPSNPVDEIKLVDPNPLSAETAKQTASPRPQVANGSQLAIPPEH